MNTGNSSGQARDGTMRAAIIERYGTPDELTTARVPQPECGENQVRIRVRAAGVNPLDWRIRNGSLRWILPARFPRVLGFDVAGEVVAVGPGEAAGRWQKGDEVMCFLDNRHGGGYAEFAAASADVVASKPAGLSFAEAAAVPLAASTALQALRDLGRISAGDCVLINGGSGGVGTFAVQVAVALGADVTAVCSTSNLDLMRELGAQHTIDYTRADFASQNRKYDIVFDTVAKSSYWKCRRVLTSDGCYITTVPSASVLILQLTAWAFGPRCRFVSVRSRAEDLRLIAQMIENGQVRPIVQQVYEFHDADQAHRDSEAGHVRGKLVLVP